MRLRKSSGCVLDVRMEEGSGSVAGDSSRYGNDGALTGCKWVERGLNFDGTNDYIDCGNDASLNFGTDDYSIIMWFKTSPTDVMYFFDSRTGNVGEASYLSYMHAGVIYFGQMYDTNKVQVIKSDDTYNDNKWHHATFVRDGVSISGYHLFVDGNEADVSVSKDVGDASDMVINNILIGSRYNLVNYFTGSIDNPRVHNRALSAREIQKQYNATKHKYE